MQSLSYKAENDANRGGLPVCFSAGGRGGLYISFHMPEMATPSGVVVRLVTPRHLYDAPISS
jgi:hypothetical protein